MNMPIFDSPGAVLTSLALLVVSVAVVFYLLSWAIRLGVRRALRDHHAYVTRYESMPAADGSASVPTGIKTRAEWEQGQP